ncbi:hypothetical protein AaE_012040, partial [Aphanomyces astaci]
MGPQLMAKLKMKNPVATIMTHPADLSHCKSLVSPWQPTVNDVADTKWPTTMPAPPNKSKLRRPYRSTQYMAGIVLTKLTIWRISSDVSPSPSTSLKIWPPYTNTGLMPVACWSSCSAMAMNTRRRTDGWNTSAHDPLRRSYGRNQSAFSAHPSTALSAQPSMAKTTLDFISHYSSCLLMDTTPLESLDTFHNHMHHALVLAPSLPPASSAPTLAPMEPLFVYALLADRANNNDPKDWRDAMSRPDRDKWLLAAKSEYESLLSNGTYVLVKRRHDETVLPCRWVFRLKADGTYKARLVVKG